MAAVLVAIAIPVFTSQLEKSREATDLSNIRSAYAEAALVVINGTTTNLPNTSVGNGVITATADANGNIITVTVPGVAIAQQTSGWLVDTSNVAGYASLGTDFQPAKGTDNPCGIKFTFGTDGKLTKIEKAS